MTQSNRPIRVLIGKPSLDGHDRGAKVLTRALRDVGMEVIYTGLRQSPEQIVSAAIQEDVDIVGLSILSGAHLGLTRKVMDKLSKADATEKKVLVGGTIPKADIPKMRDMGVAGVFPRTPSTEIVKFIQELMKEDR